MIYLLLSILGSSALFVIFKWFDYYKINSSQAIIYNYIVACICGLVANKTPFALSEIHTFNWFYYALLLGLIFITVFNLMAASTQKNGISVVAVSSKMSVIIPILFGVIYYAESLSWLKILGILIALTSVYLVAIKPGQIKDSSNLLLPFLVFIGSGIIDTSLKFLQTSFVSEAEISLFSAIIFGSAGCIGLVAISFQILNKKFKFQLKNSIAGIILGIVNYFSIYFLIQAINYKGLESSTLFTINNVGVLVASTILGVLLFKEKLSRKNKLGVLLAIIGITLVSFAETT